MGSSHNVMLRSQPLYSVALNVTKLRADNYDPREYLARLEAWRAKIEDGGGRWRMINDLERLEDLL